MTTSQDLEKHIERLRGEPAYQGYLAVRGNVLQMMDAELQDAAVPSAYWEEELQGFAYLLDASPLIVSTLREHCYHITGLRSYEYRRHHAHAAQPFQNKLARLREADKSNLFVPESPLLGGFGHQAGDVKINIDTLKFYESMIALDRAGLLDAVRDPAAPRQTWLEIGAGWGGFAYVAKTLFPNLTYMIVDLPQTLLISATYLRAQFPEARIAIYPETPLETCVENATDYDFVFLPHYVFPQITPQVDLAINMVSFQEMTTEQVTGYVTKLAQSGCPVLYSHNRDKSAHNDQLSAVGTIIKRNFSAPTEIEVLDVPYTVLAAPKPGEPRKARGPLDYRHLVSRRAQPKEGDKGWSVKNRFGAWMRGNK